MRLICPNCDAQYEVVDDVIPAEGRDVQCSNCGQTWYQYHPDHMPEEAEEEALPDELALPDDTPAPDEERVETAPEGPTRTELDPNVADILRQEAELESQARAQEAEALESQPDLGLPDAESDSERRAREARERMARMRGEPPVADQVSEAAATAAAIGSRRELLPDIEEINSTLRSTSERPSGTPASPVEPDGTPQPGRRSGFRRGFFLMIALAVVLGVIYVFAPDIARAVPQADPYLSGFVARVDTARLWLDGQLESLVSWLDSVAAQSAAE